jgi:hypothetical protein
LQQIQEIKGQSFCKEVTQIIKKNTKSH